MEIDFAKGCTTSHGLLPGLRPIEAAIRHSQRDRADYYSYEPGNATHYDVVFSSFDAGWGEETVMTVVNFNRAMIIPGPMTNDTQIGYMQEKLGLEYADCYALMPLINHYLKDHVR